MLKSLKKLLGGEPRPARRGPTRILVVRHGQTETNREGRFCGHSETALTPLGIEQARALGERLAKMPIDAVYTSDLGRAVETAALILAGRAITPFVDPDLRELHYGEWEMLRERDVSHSHHPLFRLMHAEDPSWQPPGGESLGQVRERTFAALQRIIRAHDRQTVLVVSHGTAINCMLAEVLAIAPTHTLRFAVANCGLTELTVSGGRPYVLRLNDTAHLPPPGSVP